LRNEERILFFFLQMKQKSSGLSNDMPNLTREKLRSGGTAKSNLWHFATFCSASNLVYLSQSITYGYVNLDPSASLNLKGGREQLGQWELQRRAGRQEGRLEHQLVLLVHCLQRRGLFNVHLKKRGE